MKHRMGFTLVELLVVIAIIGILVSMAIPTVQRAKVTARNLRTLAWISDLALVCETYHLDHGHYYPGQQWPSMLTGDGGPLTGSQLLASVGPSGGEVEEFAIRNGELVVIPETGAPKALSDGMYEPLPILYYPARVGQGGAVQSGTVWVFNEYVYADNEAYFTSNRLLDFHTSIREDRATTVQPREPGRFLLIAPGVDREYFTSDDLRN